MTRTAWLVWLACGVVAFAITLLWGVATPQR